MSKATTAETLSGLGFTNCQGNDKKHGTHKITVTQEGQSRNLFVVVKTVGAGTLNQIRPHWCVPLILWHSVENTWYLVSATEILRLAAQKNRGQHTESPFECCNLNFREVTSYACLSSQLVEKVKESYAELDSKPRVRALMADHILNFQEAVIQTKARVTSVLSEF